ncbi:MAG: hypothetical protein U9R39_01180 [Campylobacterota bacterium]|nr:hypothetical protein [Campylobacterota bacterium]
MKLDTEELNIEYIKENYPKEVRKDLIVSLKSLENIAINKKKTIKGIESEQKVENLHKMIDQIFSVVLKNLNWNMSTSYDSWDYRPINVMKKTFPKIEQTQWYDIRHQQVIDKIKNK